mgnify:CR=1 FL=1
MPQAPGTQGQIIDYNLMHRAGYASGEGYKRLRPDRTPPWVTMAFNFLGQEALGYVRDTKARRRAYTEKNAIFDAEIASSIAEDKGMTAIYEDAAQEFSMLRDEGQKLTARWHGLPNSKKYKKGVAMMNKAQLCLENLQMDAQTKLTMQNQFKSVEKDGTLLDDNGNPVKTKYAEYNTKDVDDRTIMFATGELDKHFQVNPDTGHLELLEEDDDNFVRIKPEAMSDEEYNKYVEDYVPEIKTTSFGDIQFNKFQDNSALDLLSESRTNGISYGDTGIAWDGTLETGLYADARTKVNQLTPAAFKSWFFSGTNYNFANSGKTFMTPAEQFLKEKYPAMEPGSTEYIGAMEQLKRQDLLEGDEYKEYAVQQMMDVTKQFYDVSKDAYDEKHKKVVTPGKDTRKNITVDGVSMPRDQADYLAREMMGGKNTSHGSDGKIYENHGNGTTTVYEMQPVYEKVIVDGKEVEVEKQPYEERKVMINKNISTIDAMGIRGLGMYIDNEWRRQVEQAQLKRTSAHLNKNTDGSVNAVLKRADQQ